MGRVLIATWDGGGNAPPAVSLAVELQHRGHQVIVMGHSNQGASVEAADLRFVGYRSTKASSGSAASNPIALLSLCADPSLGREVAQVEADLVVVDCMLFGVMAALAKRGRPYIVLEHMYDEHLTSILHRGPLALGFHARNLRPYALLDNAVARIVATLPELDVARGANIRQTGPLVDGVPAKPSEPTILLSLSTRRYPRSGVAWQRALDALAELPVSVVATSGPALSESNFRIGANTTVHPWLPHAEVLPQASLVLGHGGHATTMLALAHNVPLVIMPAFKYSDQPRVGASIARAGAGQVVAITASTKSLSREVQRVLSGPRYAQRAAELGTRIREGRGTALASDVVEEHLP